MGDANTPTFDAARYPQLADRDWLYERYVVRRMGPTAIAKEIGCKTTTSVFRALGFAGIPLHGEGGPNRVWEPTKEELLGAYLEARTVAALATRKSLSPNTIRNIFARLGLRVSDHEPERTIYRKYPQLLDKDLLVGLFRRMSGEEAARELDVPRAALARAAKLHGLRLPRGGATMETRDLGIRLYSEGHPLAEVAAMVGYDQSAVYRWLQAAGVDTSQRKRRGKAEARPPASRRTAAGPPRIQAPGGHANTCPGCGDDCGDDFCCDRCWVRLPAKLHLQGTPTTWRTTLANRPGWRATSEILDAAQAWLEARAWLEAHANDHRREDPRGQRLDQE